MMILYKTVTHSHHLCEKTPDGKGFVLLKTYSDGAQGQSLPNITNHQTLCLLGKRSNPYIYRPRLLPHYFTHVHNYLYCRVLAIKSFSSE